jgi:hypothetical protein
MNDEGIVGIDRPSGRRRPRWWQLALAAIFVFAVIAWLADTVVKTDSERAAAAFTDFIHALAESDGKRACDLLTMDSKDQLIAADQVVSGRRRDCAVVAAAQVGELSALGGPSKDELADLDQERVEEGVEIQGDKATVNADTGLAQRSIIIVRVDGEWLVDLTSTDVKPDATVDDDPSEEEIIEAADSLCTAAYPRSGAALADLDQALAAGELPEIRQSARAWARSERQLSEDLDELARVKEVRELADLIRALRLEAAAIEDAAQNPRVLTKEDSKLLDSVTAVVDVASRGGFSKFGCAAPTAADGG